MWYRSCFYCYIPITNAQGKHPIDHSCGIFQLLILPKVACDILLQASRIETGAIFTRLNVFVCFDCKSSKMFAGSVQNRQRPILQYTAAVSLDHGVRNVFPRLVDFRPVRPRRCVLRRKDRSNGIPV